MSSGTHKAPVVATFRQIKSVIESREALEPASSDANVAMDPIERAAMLASIGEAMRKLQRAQVRSGSEMVAVSVHDAQASRLQSLIASGEGGQQTLFELGTGGYEATFDTNDWLGWAKVAWEKLKHPRPHEMLRPSSATPLKLEENARIGVVGDWGTGLYGAPRIAKAIYDDPLAFTMLLHLGDVYYSGTENEVQQRFLNIWPQNKAPINRALNSNHEMYSGGEAYFGRILKEFKQEGSYFAYQNSHFTLIGLDVAYIDHAIDDIQAEWVRQVINQAGQRKVILFSHHQLYSHFETQGSNLWSHRVFGDLLQNKKIFAWYWGHEHRCVLFEAPDQRFGLWGRCIGHGGMPQSRQVTSGLPKAQGPIYGSADWRRAAGTNIGGLVLPSALVLEGRNEFIVGEEEKFSPHGYAILTFEGAKLKEQLMDPKGQVIFERYLG